MGFPISTLPPMVTPALTDEFPVRQGSATYRETVQQLATLLSTNAVLPYTVVTTTSQAMLPNNGYVSNNAALVTLTLPVTAAVGTRLEMIGLGAGGWLIAQNASQSIQVGTVTSTIGVGGSVASSNPSDSLQLICIVADTTWAILGGAQSTILNIV